MKKSIFAAAAVPVSTVPAEKEISVPDAAPVATARPIFASAEKDAQSAPRYVKGVPSNAPTVREICVPTAASARDA